VPVITAQLVRAFLKPPSHIHTYVTTVVRSPTKLETILTNNHDIPQGTITNLLTISVGDAKNPEDVANALVHPAQPTRLVDMIVFAVGAYIKPQLSLLRPFVLPPADVSVTQDCMRALFSAIDSLLAKRPKIAATKPLIVVVTATASKDVWGSVPWPWLCAPLYKWLLRSPEEDKRNMEDIVRSDGGGHVRSYVLMRPAILTDGVERGVVKVRVGWLWDTQGEMGVEREKAPGPAVGWSIGRRDVGRWMFEKVVACGGNGWEGKSVSLCY
jgi:hypothetical protein